MGLTVYNSYKDDHDTKLLPVQAGQLQVLYTPGVWTEALCRLN